MSLISRWDIRTESYADAATVTTLTDRTGTTNLGQVSSVARPTYSASENAIAFTGSEALGSASLHAELSATPSGSAWSFFVLIKQNTLAADFAFSMGKNAVNTGVGLRTQAGGTPTSLVRDNVDSTAQSAAAASAISTSTWVVLHLIYDGTTFKMGFDGNQGTGTTLTENLAAEVFDRIALGAYYRSTVGSYWTGYMREARVYNSNETANLASIVSDMKEGPTAITTVGNINTIYANSSNVVITGTGLTTGTTAKLSYANQEIMMLNYVANSTQPYFTSPSLANVFASRIQFTNSANLQILNATSSIIASKIVSLIPSPAEKLVHDVTDVSQASNTGSIYYGLTPAITVGDQIIYDTRTTSSYNVSIDSQGFIVVDSLNTDANDSFTYRVYESSSQFWGTDGTITFIGESGAAPYFSNKIKMYIRVV